MTSETRVNKQGFTPVRFGEFEKEDTLRRNPFSAGRRLAWDCHLQMKDRRHWRDAEYREHVIVLEQ